MIVTASSVRTLWYVQIHLFLFGNGEIHLSLDGKRVPHSFLLSLAVSVMEISELGRTMTPETDFPSASPVNEQLRGLFERAASQHVQSDPAAAARAMQALQALHMVSQIADLT